MVSKIKTALVLGMFVKTSSFTQDPDSDFFVLTENAEKMDFALKGLIKRTLREDGPFPPEKKFMIINTMDYSHLILRCHGNYYSIAVVDIGPPLLEKSTSKTSSVTDQRTENIMNGVAHGLKYLKAENFLEIHVDHCGEPRGVGTVSALTLPEAFPLTPDIEPLLKIEQFDNFYLGGHMDFEIGIILGKCQNLARSLMKKETVDDYVNFVKNVFASCKIDVKVRDHVWIEEKKMNALLSVAKTDDETIQPVLLDFTYAGSGEDEKPLLLVGKASSFENTFFPMRRKPEINQYCHKSGMGGASCIIGCLYGLFHLKVTTFVRAILAIVVTHVTQKPLKIGDIVYSMSGISIQVDNSLAESRLIMADVLSYAKEFDAVAIIDVTTLTSEIDLVLGTSYIGAFTKDDQLFAKLNKACDETAEKVWRMPLFNRFTELLKTSEAADLSNVGKNVKDAISCKAAAFLQEFVSHKRWMHLDITGIIESKAHSVYLPDWATGLSTSPLIYFCQRFFQ